MRQKNNISCDLCNSKNIETLYKAVEGYFGVWNTHTYLLCQDCGLVFIHPKPSSKYLNSIYEKDYHSPFDTTKKGLKWKIKEMIYHYHLTVSSSTNKRFLRVLYDFLSPYYVLPPLTSARKILDIGCGNGLFLYLFKENGWETHGIEISETSARYAERLGNKVFIGNLTDAHYPRQYFDIVVLNNVLEHISEPKEMLADCYNILKDDGTLIVAVPNFDCFDSKLLHNSWHSIHVPCHLYQFNRKSLKRLLKLCHFNVYKEQFNPILKSIIVQYCPLYPYFKSIFVNTVMNEKHISKKNPIQVFLSLVKVSSIIFFMKPIYLLFYKNRTKSFSNQIIFYAKKNFDG